MPESIQNITEAQSTLEEFLKLENFASPEGDELNRLLLESDLAKLLMLFVARHSQFDTLSEAQRGRIMPIVSLLNISDFGMPENYDHWLDTSQAVISNVSQ